MYYDIVGEYFGRILVGNKCLCYHYYYVYIRKTTRLLDSPAIGLPIRAAKPCDIQRRPKALVSRLMPRSSTIMIERRDTKAAGNGNHNMFHETRFA